MTIVDPQYSDEEMIKSLERQLEEAIDKRNLAAETASKLIVDNVNLRWALKQAIKELGLLGLPADSPLFEVFKDIVSCK